MITIDNLVRTYKDRVPYEAIEYAIKLDKLGRSINTVKSYLIGICNYCEHIGSISVFDMTMKNAEDYLMTLPPATGINRKAIIGCFFRNYLFREDEYKHLDNVVQNLPMKSQEKNLQDFYFHSEISKILNYCYSSSAREYAIFMCLFNMGLRINEVVELDRNSVTEGNIIFYRKGNKQAILRLDQYTARAIDNWLNERTDDFVSMFLSRHMKPYSTDIFRTEHKNVHKQAGVKDRNPHASRRACAAMIYDKNKDIYETKNFLSHESSVTTEIYLKYKDFMNIPEERKGQPYRADLDM